jgi:serine/threonine protein kinase
MVDEKYDYHTRLSIFICVVQIVKSLKEKGIVYIDLEPENIFVNEDEGTEEMIIRLGDLGSCKYTQSKVMNVLHFLVVFLLHHVLLVVHFYCTTHLSFFLTISMQL